MNCHMSLIQPCETAIDQSEHRMRWPQGQRLRLRIGRKYIRVLTRLTSVGNAACSFDIVTRPGNWPTANLRHVSAMCAQYGIGPTLVVMLLHRALSGPDQDDIFCQDLIHCSGR